MNPADLVMPIAQGDESEIELYRKVLSDLQSTGKYLIERKVKRADVLSYLLN